MRFRRALLLPLVIVGCYNPDDPSNQTGTDTDAGTSMGPTTVSTMGETMTSDDPTTASSTMTTTTSSPDSSGSESTGEPQACEGADGELDPSCDASTPFCQGGTCVGCDALDPSTCAAIDPTTPVCTGGVCSSCTEHDQCSTGACRIATGECFAEANRLWVDNTADCGAATGEEAAPFCTLGEAQNVLDDQPGTDPWAVFVAGSADAYTDAALISTERPLAFIGPARGLAARVERAMQYAAWVGNGEELYLARLTLVNQNADQAALDCNGGDGYFDDVAVTGSQGALDISGGVIRTRRSTFGSNGRSVLVGQFGTLFMDDGEVANQSGAMLVEGDVTLVRSRVHYSYVEAGIEVVGTLRMINTMVYDNYYQFGDILSQPGSTLEVTYGFIGPDGITCPGTPGQSQQTIRNSIVLGIDCPSAVIHNSAVGSEAAAMQGQDNALITMADWASVFVEPMANGDDLDWHVLPGAPIVTDLAVWMEGDPVDDIDGDARPARDGAADVAGPDVP
jgi:hypothetical protein